MMDGYEKTIFKNTYNVPILTLATDHPEWSAKPDGKKIKISKIIFLQKNGVFWVVTPCGSCKNRRFGGTWRLLHQGDKSR
jgi:hypothetical protein